MSAQIVFHIQKVFDKWQGKPEKAAEPVVVSANKSDVVARTIAFANKVAASAIIIIHGLDGRILEKRLITK